MSEKCWILYKHFAQSARTLITYPLPCIAFKKIPLAKVSIVVVQDS